MDIRDLRNHPLPEVPADKRLEAIFAYQRELLDSYSVIEKLPKFPFDLDIKSNQLIIKDFTARIVEEVGEGFESLVALQKLSEVTFPEDAANHFVNMVQNFNEEMADAIHFLVETFIVSGITIGMIRKFIDGKLTENDRVILQYQGHFDDILRCSFMVAQRYNIEKGFFNNLGKDLLKGHLEDELFLRGGRKADELFNKNFSILAWELTYHLQIARNSLKNKPWKQTEMTTDHQIYVNKLLDAWLSLIRLCDYSNIYEEEFFYIYYKKNRINLFRIKSKY